MLLDPICRAFICVCAIKMNCSRISRFVIIYRESKYTTCVSERKICSYDDFLSKEILPLEIREKSKRTFYTVTPIYYQHICYGYCVSDGSLFALKSELSYLWTVNIGMALENIRKWQWINRMNEKINRMWKYDMLTQVLNRSGFFYCAETILQKIKRRKKQRIYNFSGHRWP